MDGGPASQCEPVPHYTEDSVEALRLLSAQQREIRRGDGQQLVGAIRYKQKCSVPAILGILHEFLPDVLMKDLEIYVRSEHVRLRWNRGSRVLVRVDQKAGEGFHFIANAVGDEGHRGTRAANALHGCPLDKRVVDQQSAISAQERGARKLSQYGIACQVIFAR